MRSLVLSMMDIFIVKINYQPVKLNDHQGLTAFSIPMGLQFFVFYMLPNLPLLKVYIFLFPIVLAHTLNRHHCCCSQICMQVSERATICGRVSETCKSCISYLKKKNQMSDVGRNIYYISIHNYTIRKNKITIVLLTSAVQIPCRTLHQAFHHEQYLQSNHTLNAVSHSLQVQVGGYNPSALSSSQEN